MPDDGETFAGALDSLEARCRSETQSLYKSEGKEDLLGEDGVPESLRIWLRDTRERALGVGGHREGAQRKLRAQVGFSRSVLRGTARFFGRVETHNFPTHTFQEIRK